MSGFEDLFNDTLDETTDEPIDEPVKKEKIKKEPVKRKKKPKTLTDKEIEKLLENTNEKITITKLMTCYEILTGAPIRKNTNKTIDQIIIELSQVLIDHKLRNKNFTVNKEDIIKILNNNKMLEELDDDK